MFNGVISTTGDGQNNYPFRLGSDYNSYMVSVASNTWGLFWAGNVGAKYGTNGAGGPGNIWGNSGNPNEMCFVGNNSTAWSVWYPGNTWQKSYAISADSFRAPVFYDSANTAYYIDPASTGTSVNVAGDVVAYASSDIRFKNNVVPITNALDKINKIGGYTFEWNEKSHKKTGKKDIGVIAQEVEEILPEIVDTRSNGYKAVDYSKLTALLIQSVKEQQVIIDNLKSRIETLENN